MRSKIDLQNENAALRRRVAELEIVLAGKLQAGEQAKEPVEQAWFEAKEIYQTIFKTSPDAITITDIEGKILEISDKVLELYGLDDPGEAIGRFPLEFIAPQDHQRALQNIASVFQGNLLPQNQYTLLRKNGESFAGEINAALLRDASGEPKGMVAITRDISERVRAVEETRIREDLLRLTREMAKVGGWEFDAQTQQGTWTPEVARIHDLDPEQETNVELGVSFYTGESKNKIEKAISAAIERGEPYDLELELVSAKGVHKWVRTKGMPFTQDGKVVKVAGIFQDITEHVEARKKIEAVNDELREKEVQQKEAERKVRRQERLLRLFIENSPAAIAMFDRQVNYIIASRRYLIDYDLGDQNLEGRSHYEVFPEIPERWKEIHRRCLAGAVESAESDPFPRASGKMDLVRWEILPWYEDSGEIGGIILFSEVITDRKLAEEKLKAALEEKEILLREVHHRVKNNLQAMIALLQMRGSQVHDDEVRQFLKELEGQARTMSLVYEQLYRSEYLSRIDMEPYVQKLITSILDSYSGERYVAIELDVDPIHMDVARAMPCGLIINELVTNALKHAFPTGFDGAMTLWVALHQEGNILHLSVRDNGVGLPPNLDWQTTETLGIRLVNLWATHQLGGTLNVTSQLPDSAEPVTSIDIRFSL